MSRLIKHRLTLTLDNGLRRAQGVLGGPAYYSPIFELDLWPQKTGIRCTTEKTLEKVSKIFNWKRFQKYWVSIRSPSKLTQPQSRPRSCSRPPSLRHSHRDTAYKMLRHPYVGQWAWRGSKPLARSLTPESSVPSCSLPNPGPSGRARPSGSPPISR